MEELLLLPKKKRSGGKINGAEDEELIWKLGEKVNFSLKFWKPIKKGEADACFPKRGMKACCGQKKKSCSTEGGTGGVHHRSVTLGAECIEKKPCRGKRRTKKKNRKGRMDKCPPGVRRVASSPGGG